MARGRDRQPGHRAQMRAPHLIGASTALSSRTPGAWRPRAELPLFAWSAPVIRKPPVSRSSAFRRSLARYAHLFALALMAIAALFGIPLILDPPPGDRVVQAEPGGQKTRRRKPRRRP